MMSIFFSDEPKPAKKPKTVKLEGRSVMTPPSVGVTFSCKIRQLLDTMVNKLMKLVTRKPKESSDLHLIENVDWNEVSDVVSTVYCMYSDVCTW